MIGHKPIFFCNSLDLRDKVRVRVPRKCSSCRKRLKAPNEQLTSVVRKSGSSISAITKEAATLK